MFTFKYTANKEVSTDELLASKPFLRRFLPFDKITVVTVGTAVTIYVNGDVNQELYVKADDTQLFENLVARGWKVVLATTGTVRLICQKTKV